MVATRKVPLKETLEAAKKRMAEETMRLQRSRPIWPKEYSEDTFECAWAFLLKLRTWDEAKKQIRPFPNKRYLRQFTKDWWRCRKEGRTLYIRKCRRMVISWACRGLELWAMGLERQDQMLGGDDYGAAAKHCWRIEHYYLDLMERFDGKNGNPNWHLKPSVHLLYEGERAIQMFGLANGSRVTIVNAKSKSVQGEGTAIATFEEIGLYDDPGAVMAQAQIICMGDAESEHPGGFVCCITNLTTNPRQHKLEFREQSEADFVEVFPGYKTRTMAGGELFIVMEWNADEARDAAWLERLRVRMKLHSFDFRLQILMVLEGRTGALWSFDVIDQFRLPGIPRAANIERTIIAIDPSVTDREKLKDPRKEPDECGIVVIGIDDENHAYVRFDLSGILSPEEIVFKVVNAGTKLEVDEIIYEENQGKHWIPALFKAYGCRIPLRGVVATEGKRTRAEPTVIPYQLGHVHHIGFLSELEKEQTTWDSTNPGQKSPGRIDALVWGLTSLGLCVELTAEIIDNLVDDDPEQVF